MTNLNELSRRDMITGGSLGHSADAASRRGFMGSTLALGALAMMPPEAGAQTGAGQVTCHFLDTYGGRPGGGIKVELSMLEAGAWKVVKSVIATDAGRPADPLISGDSMVTGSYMLEFFYADYFKARAFLPSPPFFDRVTHFFAVPAKTTRYHITLVGAPWGYTTYRWKE